MIVPVGAKGVCRQAAAGRGSEAFPERGESSPYKNFINGLLDLTDNLMDGAVVPPDRVVKQDPDDSYLVVAADKGYSDLFRYRQRYLAGA